MNIAGIQKPMASEDKTMNIRNLLMKATKAHALLVKCGTMLQSPLLLTMQAWWGWSFFQTGLGKLKNHADTAEFFGMLGIPMRGLNAWVAGGVECVGVCSCSWDSYRVLQRHPFRSS